ncbi:ubiquitin-conjugating enzyme/RWD-like protein [Bisporella sp. PMI_857]|nr:ubiquitin-conjugating enzyme/RWD-like protein [Bisporella sp. PMI_857]
MVPSPLASLSAVRKQNLLVEFSSLKYACPYGVFVSLTPGDPSLWSGVLFIRKGPYAPSILRFQISFPPSYPSLPPLVTFSTDMFHPLITPLTTYMYTTDIQDGGTVSATDEERLPPGGFSLRNGFPDWFGRTKARGLQSKSLHLTPTSTPMAVKNSPGTTGSSASGVTGNQSKITIYEVLRYIRGAFDEEEILDQIPLEAAGNPGAWHAWRSHRIKSGILLPDFRENSNLNDGLIDDGNDTGSNSSIPEGYQVLAGGTSAPFTARRPGEWNWEGVWEVRVKKGIDASMSDAALFGKESGDDLIRFLKLDGEELNVLKERISTFMETSELQRKELV